MEKQIMFGNCVSDQVRSHNNGGRLALSRCRKNRTAHPAAVTQTSADLYFLIVGARKLAESFSKEPRRKL